MRVAFSWDEVPPLPPVALSIGVFDGVHLGHQVLLKALVQTSLFPVVVTFQNSPLSFFQKAPSPILSLEERLYWLKVYGIQFVLALPFQEELASWSYIQFLEALLASFPLKHLILGEGATFGKNKEGSEERVRPYALEHNFQLSYLPKLPSISSTQIRSLLQQNKREEALRLLGHPLEIQP